MAAVPNSNHDEFSDALDADTTKHDYFQISNTTIAEHHTTDISIE